MSKSTDENDSTAKAFLRFYQKTLNITNTFTEFTDNDGIIEIVRIDGGVRVIFEDLTLCDVFANKDGYSLAMLSRKRLRSAVADYIAYSGDWKAAPFDSLGNDAERSNMFFYIIGKLEFDGGDKIETYKGGAA